MKKILLFCGICSLLFISCGKEVTIAYSFGISEYRSASPTDFDSEFITITDYLEVRNCPTMSKTFTGKNIKDTDQQARTAFMEAIANISANEIDLLRLNAGTSFVYSVRRYEDATNPDSDVIVLAEYSYPQS